MSAHSSTIHNNQNVGKTGYVHTMDYYLAIRHEVLVQAVTWVNLSNIILSVKKPHTKGYILQNSTFWKYLE